MYDIDKVFTILPKKAADEILRLADSRVGGEKSISEIRLRAIGRSSVIFSAERVSLSVPITHGDIKQTLSLICGGSLYSYRDSIRDGYVTLGTGVRVGICGQARYDGGALVGVSEASSLIFRIPTGTSDNADELYRARLNSRQGMIIYSRPGVGKTTALRTLAALIGGKGRMQVSVIDERMEFCPEDYRGMSVDLYRGYKRERGMEIALRSASPDVMIIDEIGRREEAVSMLESLNSGVKVIATAHASSISELMKRVSLAPFFENRIFDVAVGLVNNNGRREIEVTGL